jgi:hypothetical protein
VLDVDPAAPHRDGSRVTRGEAQLRNRSHDADDVENGIGGAHLVEMDLLHSGAVHTCFRFGDTRERLLRVLLRAVVHVRAIDDLDDVTQMTMRFLGRIVEANVRCCNAAALDAFDLYRDVADAKIAYETTQPVIGQSQVQQGRHCHVAADAGEGIEEERAHYFAARCRCCVI